MTCEEMLAALNDYFNAARLSADCEKFAEHLAGCRIIRSVRDWTGHVRFRTPFFFPWHSLPRKYLVANLVVAGQSRHEACGASSIRQQSHSVRKVAASRRWADVERRWGGGSRTND